MFLSIIVTAFNVEDYIGACLDQLIQQLDWDTELIVVDDGSTDGTGEIAERYVMSYAARMRVIHQRNCGPCRARNRGLEAARGKWVWFVDGDDLVAPWAVSRLRKYDDGSHQELIRFDHVSFADGTEVTWGQRWSGECDRTEVDGWLLLRSIYERRQTHYLWAGVFRRNVLIRYGNSVGRGAAVFPEEFSLYEDVVFMEELLRRLQCIVIVPEVLYGYRCRGTSMVHSNSNASARSGLAAVRLVSSMDTPHDLELQKQRMLVGLLFSVYRIAEVEWASCAFRREVAREINVRVSKVGLRNLGRARLMRLIALRSGLLDVVLVIRSALGR